MGKPIRSRIIEIGNSQGIRIPKPLLEQSGISKDVEIEVKENYLIIRPVSGLRVGWNKAFAAMAEVGDDVLLDDVNTTEWDQLEWEW
jgi:antitoxin MazE